jgi:hypothetical protein
MSKNTDRYKAPHLEDLDEDELLEIDTEHFEKFAPKKKDGKNKSKHQPKDFDREE